ncbi:MAG: DUF1902 domain-containing protein [Spirochaetaceae bacterium]|jgi:hypothetical protein|nr:DUF1902 domain-containing protein [Spirochaetaceae bacterium]
MTYTVYIHHDDEDNIWYSTSKDIPGFVAGASSLDLLIQESNLTIYDLLGVSNFKVQFIMNYENEVHYG